MYIDDVTIETDVVNATTGIIYYKIDIDYNNETEYNPRLFIEIIDKNDFVVANESPTYHTFNGEIQVPNARLWWPYLMNSEYGYLYTMKVSEV